MEPVKPWYLSRTFWFNALTLAVAIVDLLAGSPLFGAYADTLIVVSSVGNKILRFLTVAPLGIFRE